WQYSTAGNLPSVVDVKCIHHFDVRAGQDEDIDVNHLLAAFGEEAWPSAIGTVSRIAYHLALGVNAVGGAVQTRSQDSEISHHAVLPQKCVMIRALQREVRPADYQTRIADP